MEKKPNEVVFKSNRLKVTSDLFTGDAIFVTFQSAISVGLHQKGFGEDFFRKRGISAVHVVPEHHCWYQYREMVDACAAIREVTSRYKRVITYGTSMGGYAALNFATLVGATDVISISPQYTIDPTRVPFENRYADGFPDMDGFVYDQPAGRDWSGTSAFILFDPKDTLDGMQAFLAASDTPVNLVSLPHSTHPCTQVISNDALKEFLLVSASSGVASAITPLARRYKQERGGSWVYWLDLARRGGLRSPHRALKCALQADRLNPENPDILHVAGSICLSMGLFPEAQTHLSRATELRPSDPFFVSSLVQALIGLGQYKPASKALISAEDLGLPLADTKYLRRQIENLDRAEKRKTFFSRLRGKLRLAA